MTKLYCLRFETPPTRRARSPYLNAPGTGWPGYTPRHWVLFSSLPTIRKATVEVFYVEPLVFWSEFVCCWDQWRKSVHRLFAIIAEAFVACQCCNLHKSLPWKRLCIISLNRALFVGMFVSFSFPRKRAVKLISVSYDRVRWWQQ
jgi:hypothetical protein